MGADLNFIEKSGSWYSYEGERIGQGRENARQWLKDHPDEAQVIRARILNYYEPEEDEEEEGEPVADTDSKNTIKAEKEDNVDELLNLEL